MYPVLFSRLGVAKMSKLYQIPRDGSLRWLQTISNSPCHRFFHVYGTTGMNEILPKYFPSADVFIESTMKATAYDSCNFQSSVRPHHGGFQWRPIKALGIGRR